MDVNSVMNARSGQYLLVQKNSLTPLRNQDDLTGVRLPQVPGNRTARKSRKKMIHIKKESDAVRLGNF